MSPFTEMSLLGEAESFSDSHLSDLRARYGDMRIIYRALFVGEYLSNLVDEGLDPLFKGGSSLMFMLPGLRRVSEDIDIALSDLTVLQPALQGLQRRFGGMRIEREERPGNHYQLPLPSPAQGYVLLDVVEGEPGYAVQKLPLRSAMYSSSKKVRAPTLNALLGDKLTTHGERIGLQSSRPSVEPAKQLYDLHVLLQHFDDLAEVWEAFQAVVGFQCQYRSVTCSPEQALDDLHDAMRRFILTAGNSQVPPEWVPEVDRLRDGLQALSNFLESHNRFSSSHARVEAARIMFFGRILRDLRGSLRAADVQRAFNNVSTAITDDSILVRARVVLQSSEPTIYSRDLERGAPAAFILAAAAHEPGLLLD